MSENSNKKKPHGRLFKNFIGGLFFSCIFWGVFIFLGFAGVLGDEYTGLSILLYCGISIILVISGTIGYVLVKLWNDFFYSHFTVFTRHPIMLLLNRYIIEPAIGVIAFPFLILYLVMKLMGEV